MNQILKNPPPRGSASGLPKVVLGSNDESITRNRGATLEANAQYDQLLEIKRDSIWTLCRLSREHVDRLLCALEAEDDGETWNQCRATVAHIRAVAVLVTDYRKEGAQ